MKRLFLAATATLVLAGLAVDARAQGCPGQPAPGLASGRTMMKSGFPETITCPVSGPNFLIFGTTQLTPGFPLGSPPMCNAACSLDCLPVAVVVLPSSTFLVTPPRVRAPVTLCVQSVGYDAALQCFVSSGVLPLVVIP